MKNNPNRLKILWGEFMEKFIITGGEPLCGSVRISGSKNSALPILAACLLSDEESVIEDVPNLSDIKVMLEIISRLGRKSSFDIKNQIVRILPGRIKSSLEDFELASRLRASFLAAGPLLARLHQAKVPLPGGCAIGLRPVDLHLKGFSLLGAKIVRKCGYIFIKAKKLSGTKIYLDFPSVGATENLLMASALAEGETTIENAAIEPEILDLCEFLNKMGARVSGIGTGSLSILGVKKLNGARHKIIPDRIEAGTYMAAAAITKGDVLLKNVQKEHIQPMLSKLKEANVGIEELPEGVRVFYIGAIAPIRLKTLPFPGFPTDLQAPLMSLLTLAGGTSIITETIFENRFMQAAELERMGASIRIESRSAVIEGVKKLTGAKVHATDLRAGAALVLSALAAEGDTEISDIYHIERGYDHMEEKLKALGAKMRKEDAKA